MEQDPVGRFIGRAGMAAAALGGVLIYIGESLLMPEQPCGPSHPVEAIGRTLWVLAWIAYPALFLRATDVRTSPRVFFGNAARLLAVMMVVMILFLEPMLSQGFCNRGPSYDFSGLVQ
ncbi:MAG TPA: hypothetical protein HA286_02285 [Candidatus Poseidoniaceae archaeon]|nr:hypothetical protein [Candidatus Poseidoniaceae archaeon]